MLTLLLAPAAFASLALAAGFAWRARGTDNFVIRGGIGLYYGNQSTRNTIQIAELLI